jgi:hypothetical protein
MKGRTKVRVFKNWVLRKVRGSKMDKVTGDWRKLHNDELCDMYSSPNIICVLKWRRMRWVSDMVQMGKREVRAGFWQGNLKERDKFENQSADGKVILKWVLKK